MKTGVKISLGLGGLILLMLISSFAIRAQVSSAREITEQATYSTIKLQTPTIENSLKLESNMYLSLAGLRGWMLLGQESFKQDRKVAWKQLDDCMIELERLSSEWTTTADVERLKVVKSNLVEFRKHQQDIEDIVQTPENLPASKILFTEAAPRGEIIIKSITTLIDLEKLEMSSNERKLLLLAMADFRGSMAMGLANIRAYLLGGDELFLKRYQNFEKVRKDAFKRLQRHSKLLKGKQVAAFKTLDKNLSEFNPLPAQMFAIRGSKEWNKANLWLATRAAPLAKKIVKDAHELVASQAKLNVEGEEMMQASAKMLDMVMWASLALAVLLAFMISIVVVRGVSKPIEMLAAVATKMSLGENIEEPLDIKASGEVRELTNAMERLRISMIALMDTGDDDDF